MKIKKKVIMKNNIKVAKKFFVVKTFFLNKKSISFSQINCKMFKFLAF